MIAIGLDPSLTAWGWSVLYGHRLEFAGVWRTEKTKGPTVAADNEVRFGFLAQSLVSLLEAHRNGDGASDDATIFVEGLPTFMDRFTTVQGQGRCRGIVDGVAAALKLRVIEVPPAEVKKIVMTFDRRKVEKTEVRDRVLELYPNAVHFVPSTKLGLNISDAIAIAHQGAKSLEFQSHLRDNNGSRW